MKQAIQPIDVPIDARITIPGSKSMTNRALLLAALADGVSELSGILFSDDTRALMNALRTLGIMMQWDEQDCSCIVGGSGGVFPKKEASIWCDAAGTVARFLLAACAASPGQYEFDGMPQLRQRPIEPLLRVLCAQGAQVVPANAKAMPFFILGSEGLKGGEIEIEASKTGQYISALLMIAPLAQTQVEIITFDTIVGQSYIEMTMAMMAEFGVMVRRLHHARFLVPVPQRYSAMDYVVEPDLSTASYFFAAAAVTGGRVTIQAVDIAKSKQGDAKFLFLLEKMGCKIESNSQGLTVIGTKELKGVNADMRDFSDTFMTLAAIAPFANSPTTITNVGHTRLQESDRIMAMRKGLEALQIKVEEGPDWLRIYPSIPIGAMIESHQDHRIAMAFSVIGLRVVGVVINGAESVAKTCPEFFQLWGRLTS